MMSSVESSKKFFKTEHGRLHIVKPDAAETGIDGYFDIGKPFVGYKTPKKNPNNNNKKLPVFFMTAVRGAPAIADAKI